MCVDGDLDLDIELPAEVVAAAAQKEDVSGGDYFVMPLQGKSALQKWSTSSALAADLVQEGIYNTGNTITDTQQCSIILVIPFSSGPSVPCVCVLNSV